MKIAFDKIKCIFPFPHVLVMATLLSLVEPVLAQPNAVPLPPVIATRM